MDISLSHFHGNAKLLFDNLIDELRHMHRDGIIHVHWNNYNTTMEAQKEVHLIPYKQKASYGWKHGIIYFHYTPSRNELEVYQEFHYFPFETVTIQFLLNDSISNLRNKFREWVTITFPDMDKSTHG
jgi:hypothetical protein